MKTKNQHCPQVLTKEYITQLPFFVHHPPRCRLEFSEMTSEQDPQPEMVAYLLYEVQWKYRNSRSLPRQYCTKKTKGPENTYLFRLCGRQKSCLSRLHIRRILVSTNSMHIANNKTIMPKCTHRKKSYCNIAPTSTKHLKQPWDSN